MKLDSKRQKPFSNNLMLKREAEWKFCDHVHKKSRGLNIFIKIFFVSDLSLLLFCILVSFSIRLSPQGGKDGSHSCPSLTLLSASNNLRTLREQEKIYLFQSPHLCAITVAERMRDWSASLSHVPDLMAREAGQTIKQSINWGRGSFQKKKIK